MAPPSPEKAKSHRRSRFGCRNCKLRKLKCDENKPQCRRCRSFRVTCNFLPGTADLQPVAAQSPHSLVIKGRQGIEVPFRNPVWTSDASTSYELSIECQDFIMRYLGQSLITPKNPTMAQLNLRLLELAFTHPYLMHASLAVAFTYDRYSNGSTGSRRTVKECYHWSQSTILLNKCLRQPIRDEDKDAIWGTSAALALQTYSSPDACTPEQSWPLKTSGSSDLAWLRMNEAKMSLGHVVNPLRPESIFCVMADAFAHMSSPLPVVGVDGIPAALVAVCKLDASSTANSSPYFHATHALCKTLHLADDKVMNSHTQIFTRSIRGVYKDLLQGRDPVAILLLYLWYRKVGRSIWWIELRARVECPAICQYLQMYHGENDGVLAFLPGGVLADAVVL